MNRFVSEIKCFSNDLACLKDFFFELTLTPGSNSFFIFNTHLLLLPIRSIMQVCKAVGRSENMGGRRGVVTR